MVNKTLGYDFQYFNTNRGSPALPLLYFQIGKRGEPDGVDTKTEVICR